MSIRHLYSSRAEVQRLSVSFVKGSAITDWFKLNEIVDTRLGVVGEMMCRLDLNFVRPGKDQPSALVAGRAIDRVGVLFCDATPYLLAGDRIKMLSGPIMGTFELKATPDGAVDFSAVHHLEVQVVEVAPSAVRFPGSVIEGA